MNNLPIVVCTLGSPSLPVLEASIKAYAPEHELLVSQGGLGNFGDDYNAALTEAFKTHDAVFVANDDVVLNKDVIPTMLADLELIRYHVPDAKVGYIGVRSDFVRQCQNIRYNDGSRLLFAEAISPIFAYLSKEAFEAVQFPPLNWYSDDVMCEDLSAQGFKHYVSRAYLHHAGSMTVGHDAQRLTDEAKPWILLNRPEYAKKWFELI